MRLFENASYDFLGGRRAAYIGSAVTISLAIAIALFWQVSRGSWLNYGVDFTGGTIVQVSFTQATSVAELRGTFPEAEITRFGEETEFLIRVQAFSQEMEGERATAAGDVSLDDNISELIDARLAQAYPPGSYQIERTEAVGPKIGAELQQRAALAILLSFGLTLLYLAFRFEWRFGVAAVIATLHDIVVTLGFISAFQLEVSLPTVAAVLTIVGYSLNDTIVVFDRVRENLKKLGRRVEYKDILNRSINETLPRTVMTSGTTVATLLALYLLGGAIIRDFAMILMFGILVGTYSSIWVASPALLEIEKRWKTQPGKPSPKTTQARVSA